MGGLHHSHWKASSVPITFQVRVGSLGEVFEDGLLDCCSLLRFCHFCFLRLFPRYIGASSITALSQSCKRFLSAFATPLSSLSSHVSSTHLCRLSCNDEKEQSSQDCCGMTSELWQKWWELWPYPGASPSVVGLIWSHQARLLLWSYRQPTYQDT